MLDRVLRELGWYNRPNGYVETIKYGSFEIENGSIAPTDFLNTGDYFRIVGSRQNDGLYQYPAADLTDELFDGAVWVMRIPPAVVTLAQEINDFAQSEAAKPSAYTSESFGGYSYTKGTSANGAPLTWKRVFADELNAWRIM